MWIQNCPPWKLVTIYAINSSIWRSYYVAYFCDINWCVDTWLPVIFLSKMRVTHHHSSSIPFKLTSRKYKLLGFAQIWMDCLKYTPLKLLLKMCAVPKAALFTESIWIFLSTPRRHSKDHAVLNLPLRDVLEVPVLHCSIPSSFDLQNS